MLPFSKKTAILISIFSAFMAAVGDMLLLYNSNGGYEEGNYHFLNGISLNRLLVGHYLGLIFIPLYIFGFYILFDLYHKKSPRLSKMLFWLSSLLLFPGVAYHTYVSALALDVQSIASSKLSISIEALKYFSEPMAGIFVFGFIIFSTVLGWSIYKEKSELSMHVAFANPILVYILCVLCYIFVPSIGSFMIVAGFNLSILVLFVGIAIDQWNKDFKYKD